MTNMPLPSLPKVICVPLRMGPGNHWLAFCHYSFAFFGMSYEQNHRICCLLCLASVQHVFEYSYCISSCSFYCCIAHPIVWTCHHLFIFVLRDLGYLIIGTFGYWTLGLFDFWLLRIKLLWTFKTSPFGNKCYFSWVNTRSGTAGLYDNYIFSIIKNHGTFPYYIPTISLWNSSSSTSSI